MLFDIKSKDYQQRSFFEEKNVTVKNDILMKLMDGMNAKNGSNSLNFAAQRISVTGKRRGDLHSLNKSHKLPLVN
jgi:hypothetical protein